MGTSESKTAVEAWVVFDKSKIVGVRKTDRFDLKAGQRAVRLVLRFPSSLFENEYPTVTVEVDDKREILDREIGVEIGGEDGQEERRIVEPGQYVQELYGRLIEDGEVTGLPRWAFASLLAEIEHHQKEPGGFPDYDSGMTEVDGKAVRFIRIE